MCIFFWMDILPAQIKLLLESLCGRVYHMVREGMVGDCAMEWKSETRQRYSVKLGIYMVRWGLVRCSQQLCSGVVS